jgi:hypothetical protein
MDINMIDISGTTFVREATDFFANRHSSHNGLLTVKLLLFLNMENGHYCWRVLDGAIEEIVLHGLKYMAPVGGVYITFEHRSDNRIGLTRELDVFVDPRFDKEEVFNNTVPYFMREKFNYGLSDVVVRDLTSN